MSDASPEQYAEFATQDGPGSADVDGIPAEPNDPELNDPAQVHPEHDAHGGSMAPGLVDDAGNERHEPDPATGKV